MPTSLLVRLSFLDGGSRIIKRIGFFFLPKYRVKSRKGIVTRIEKVMIMVMRPGRCNKLLNTTTIEKNSPRDS